MTNEQAIKFLQSGWWRDKTAEQVTALQLYEDKACLPNPSYYHKAVAAALGRPVLPREYISSEKLREEFEQKCPNAKGMKAEMTSLKAAFCYDLYNEQVARLDSCGVHVSPDFQCDQTGGFPTSLCVNWEEGKAWLALNESLVMDRDDMDIELDDYRQLCADFGIRDCRDEEQFNSILRSLGDEALENAELPMDEGEEMRW